MRWSVRSRGRVLEVGEQYFRVGHRDRLQVDSGPQVVRDRCAGVGIATGSEYTTAGG